MWGLNRKWLSALGALVLVVGIVTGGGTALAKEKYKEIANVSHRGASGYAPEHTLLPIKWERKCMGTILKLIYR